MAIVPHALVWIASDWTVRLAGFSFDSSRIEFGNHPLYGSIEMTEYENVEAGIYKFQDFIEFRLPHSQS